MSTCVVTVEADAVVLTAVAVTVEVPLAGVLQVVVPLVVDLVALAEVLLVVAAATSNWQRSG